MAGGDVIHGCYVATDQTVQGLCQSTTDSKAYWATFRKYKKEPALCAKIRQGTPAPQDDSRRGR